MAQSSSPSASPPRGRSDKTSNTAHATTPQQATPPGAKPRTILIEATGPDIELLVRALHRAAYLHTVQAHRAMFKGQETKATHLHQARDALRNLAHELQRGDAP